MLQNLKLDMLKFRSSGIGSAIEDQTSATQEARALSRDIGHVVRGGGGAPEALTVRSAPRLSASASARDAVGDLARRFFRREVAARRRITLERRRGDRRLQPLADGETRDRGRGVPTASRWARAIAASFGAIAAVSSARRARTWASSASRPSLPLKGRRKMSIDRAARTGSR